MTAPYVLGMSVVSDGSDADVGAPGAGWGLVPFVLRTASDLRALGAERLPPRLRPLRLDLPVLSVDEAAQRALRLTELRNDCGRATGAAYAIGALAIAGAWMAWLAPTDPAAMVDRVLVSLAAALVAGGVGMTIGIRQARRELRREIASLLVLLEHRGRREPRGGWASGGAAVDLYLAPEGGRGNATTGDGSPSDEGSAPDEPARPMGRPG